MTYSKKLKIKPISVNEAWQVRGFRKFKSKKYKDFQTEVYKQLGKKKWNFESSDLLDVNVQVGFSNKLSDLDNALKPLFDTLSDYYDWNDNKIYKIKTEKFIVPKKEEYIHVKFKIYTGSVS